MKPLPTTGMDFERQEIQTQKKKSLYNIQDDYNILIQDIEEAEGILSEEMEAALEINKADLNKKSIGYLEVIRTKEAFNLMIDNEVKRLQGLKKSNNNVVDRLKDSLLTAVKVFGEFTVGTVTFKTRKSSSLVIENEDDIPKKYLTKVVTTKIDKDAIKKDLKGSVVAVKYASIQEKLNLSIK